MTLIPQHQAQLLAFLSQDNPDPTSSTNFLVELFEIIGDVPETDEHEREILAFMNRNSDQIRDLSGDLKAKLLISAIISRNSVWFGWLVDKKGGNFDLESEFPFEVNRYYQQLLQDDITRRYKIEDVIECEFKRCHVEASDEVIEEFENILADARLQRLVPLEDIKEIGPFIARVRAGGIIVSGRAVSQLRTVSDALNEAR